MLGDFCDAGLNPPGCGEESGQSPANQLADVVAAESEAEVHGVVNLGSFSRPREVIQIALRVRILQIDRGGSFPSHRASEQNTISRAAAAPIRWPVMLLVELIRRASADEAKACLRASVSAASLSFCSRAMGIDVEASGDFRRIQTRIPEALGD